MSSLAGFLGEYEAALNQRDALGVAACYAERFMHLSRRHDGWSDGWRKNDAEFFAGLERAFDFYDALDAARFERVLVNVTWPQPAHTLAKVAWRVMKKDGSELVTLEVSYMIRVRQERPMIVAFTDHDEEGRLIERGHPANSSLLFTLPRQEARPRATESGKVHAGELHAALERRGPTAEPVRLSVASRR